MSRRSAARKRVVEPDPIYHSELVAKLINCVMQDGKKSIAEGIVYGALNRISARDKSAAEAVSAHAMTDSAKKNALEALKKALDNASPKVEVKSRRVGGSTYQVPVEVRADRRDAVGMRLLVTYAKKRGGEKTMQERLAGEITDAAKNHGGAVKKCDEIHRMAEANKAFAHYRW
jgi:small subunit ribosomal protein S7